MRLVRVDLPGFVGSVPEEGTVRRRAAVEQPLPPTLVAYCRDDHMLEPEIAEGLARRIPGARRLVFETGGHNLQKTRAPELAAAILELLGSQ